MTEMVVTDEINSAHYESKCDNEVSMSWEMAAGVAVEGSDMDDATSIEENGSEIWRFFMHFEDRPGDFYPDHCPEPGTGYFRARPHNFSFHIAGRDSDTYFSGEDPSDDDGPSDNEQLGLALDIIDSVGNVYVSGATAIVDYLMAGGGSHTEVDWEPGGMEYTFDIDVDGDYDDLPREKFNPNVAAVYLRTHNEHESGIHYVDYVPEYTFEYAEFTSWSGVNCGCGDRRINHKYRSSIPGIGSGGGTAHYTVE